MRFQFIGAIITLCSVLLFCTIVISGAIISVSLSEWSGTKLWYAIFQSGGEGAGLTFLFSLSIILFIFGTILMCWDYIKKLNTV